MKDFLAKVSELISREWLGEDIGELFFGRNMLNGDVFVANVMDEVMKFDRQVLSSWTEFRVRSNLNCTSIVLENLALDMGVCEWNWNSVLLEFLKQVHQAQNIAKCSAEGNVFAFAGT